MPRPGPRPYECVRRAWHSDRHQPIRGSLIQEIFRVASEVHNPATRKNKEWLEKLPLVVLKAEEIMYSKANSEAEYVDLKTLWDRTNDAIDTIIRRDDTPETEGDLLQPCIEAALNLGCIPRRASRSQRHNNPGCYLSSATTASSLKIPDFNKGTHRLGSSVQLFQPPPPPPHPSNQQSSLSPLESWFSTLVTPINGNHFSPEANSVIPDGCLEPKNSVSISNCGFAIPSMDSPLPYQDRGLSGPLGTYTCPSVGRVYPLCYSNEQPKVSSQPSLLSPRNPTYDIITASKCGLPSACEAGMGFLHNFIGSNNTKGASSSNFGEASENPTDIEYDLSLRLGLFSPPSLDEESAWAHDVEDMGSSSSCDGSKFFNPSPSRMRDVNFENSFSSSKSKGFDFFPIDTTDEPLDSCSSKWSSEGEGNAASGGFI